MVAIIEPIIKTVCVNLLSFFYKWTPSLESVRTDNINDVTATIKMAMRIAKTKYLF